MTPTAVDLYCGLGGWAEGFLAEGYRVIGFDIERHDYGTGGYPGELVLQDVLTLHGSQFKNATCIVASPPCQAYSYRAMPWKRAKALPPPDNSLFEACFRIQREACAAAGRYIPLVVENVRGAEKWVGSAAWHFGSYYLWGDVPALMPITLRATAVKTSGHINKRNGHSHKRHLTNQREHTGIKSPGTKLSEVGFNVRNAQIFREHKRIEEAGVKMQSPGHYKKPSSGPDWFDGGPAAHGSKSDSRKASSAQIAKIPFPLAQHIARTFKP
jgi:hypothetical protein